MMRSVFSYCHWILPLLVLSLAVAACRAHDPPPLRNDGTLEFVTADGRVLARIAIEIAETPEEHDRGLMHRLVTDDLQGMLFVFEDERIRGFWMRNTPGSLDMLFVGGDGRVLNIAAHTKPLSDQIYQSRAPARYVVEVRAGFSERHGITPGSRIRWQRH